MKKMIFVLIAFVTLALGTNISNANTLEEALGDVDIHCDGTTMNYLIAGRGVQNLKYAYYNYYSPFTGENKEIPAYCVNPNDPGAGQLGSYTVNCENLASDPKLVGIVSNGYPRQSYTSLGLKDKYEAYYATKMALWSYLINGWNINTIKINPNCSDQDAAARVLNAAKNIYNKGVTWTETIQPTLTAIPVTSTTVEDKVDNKYLSQEFIVKANTYLPNGAVSLRFAKPEVVPDGVKIVDPQTNREITQVNVTQDGNYLSGKFKVLYPKDIDEDEIEQVQINLQALQFRYVVYYGVSYDAEKQDYLCDTDPSYISYASVTSTLATQEAEIEDGTWLKIKKYETGTNIPLEGCVFEVIGPEGQTIGRYTTPANGEIRIPLNITGNFTVKEISSSKNHLIGDNSTQNVTVRYNEVAEVSFYNDAYGILEIEKIDADNGSKLSGAIIQAKNIATGTVQTITTGISGIARLDAVIGAWEITEIKSPTGYLLSDEVITVNVEPGKVSRVTLKNTSTPSLRIIKMDKVNNVPLSGAVFEVYRDTEFIGSYETGEMGEILLSDLDEGTYLVKEVSISNPSYVVDSYPQQIEVVGGKTAELVFFNLKKSGINLLKVDSQTYEPISNVIFEIKQIGGDFVEERITSEDGTINLSDLEPSSYEIREKTDGLNGYVIDNGVRVVKIEAGEPDALFVFTNTKKPSLNIIKVSAKGEPIPNAVFSVSQIGKTPVEYKTNSQGIIYLEGLDPTVISVIEKSVGDSYILDPTEYVIELFPGKTSQLVVVNDEKPKLKIIKTDSVTGKSIAGTKFKVNKANNSTIGIFTTDENGEILIDKQDEGVVEITEVYVPETHILSDIPQSVTLVRNKTAVVQFENEPKSSLKIVKTDAVSNTRLEGAVFEIIRKDSSSETSLGEFTTDENGEIFIDNLPFTRYEIFEREAPRGYKALTESKEVIIEGHENRVVTFVNDALSPLYIKKIDSKTREPIANARFRVTKMNGEFVYEGETNIYGFIVIPEAEPTWYTVTEISVDGYVLDSTPKNVEVKLGEPAMIEFYNSPYGDLVIQKVDNLGKTLEGVQFSVTTIDGQNVGTGLYETNSEGRIVINSIKPDFLIIQELKTLSTHILDETPKTIEIKSGETYMLKVVNDVKSGLIIKKTIAGTDEPLANCKFVIKEIDGTNIGTYKTDKNGMIYVSLEPMWVTVQEISCPEGYALDSEVKLVEILANEPTVLEVENEQLSGIRIKKVCSETGEGLYGVRFLVKDNKNNIIGCYTTDQWGYVDLTYELKPGKYKLEEISTKTGYVLDTEEKTIRVREGYTEEILWENEPMKGQIQIIKKSSEYNEITKLPAGSLLQGAIFEIYNSKNNRIVDRIITDERGIAASKPLPLGNYLIKEVQSSPYYQVNSNLIKADIKVNGDIVMFEVYNNNAKLGVTVKKVGNLEVQAGNQMRYDISNVSNTSNVPLDNFYLHDRLPTDAARLDKIITGTWNQRLDYSIYYKTNYRDYSLLVGNIASYINHEILCTETALGLMVGEYITDIKFEFGTVEAGFKEIDKPMLFVSILPNVQNNYKFVNYIDVAGKYINEWQLATDLWITNVYSRAKQEKLPVTGY